MAIINSLAIGKSVKSAGNLTFKTVRGRTIASQRITQNKSNTFLQIAQRGRFSTLSKCMQLVQLWIDNTYEKSKYGSSRNQFAKLNKNFNLNGLYNNIVNGSSRLLDGFAGSFANATNEKALKCKFVSYGSYPAIVNEATSIDSELSVGKATYNNIKNCGGYIVTFPTGVSFDKIELKVFALREISTFFDFEIVKLKQDINGTVSIDTSDSNIAIEVISESSKVTAENGIVSSLAIYYNTESTISNDCFFVVPFIEGKTVKISAPGFKQKA